MLHFNFAIHYIIPYHQVLIKIIKNNFFDFQQYFSGNIFFSFKNIYAKILDCNKKRSKLCPHYSERNDMQKILHQVR